MLGADAGEDGGVEGEDVEDVAGCAAGCVVSGEEKQFNLAHGELFKGTVHDLCFASCLSCYVRR